MVVNCIVHIYITAELKAYWLLLRFANGTVYFQLNFCKHFLFFTESCINFWTNVAKVYPLSLASCAVKDMGAVNIMAEVSVCLW